MANLTESPIYEPGIFQLEKTTPPLGGAPAFNGPNPSAGHANAQASQLANRTAWLKSELADIQAQFSSLLADINSYNSIEQGAGIVGYNDSLPYLQNSVGNKLQSLDDRIDLVSVGNKTYSSYSNMVADLSPGEGTTAIVTSDPNSTLNGWYSKLGGSGTGSWVRLSNQPVSYSQAERLFLALDETPIPGYAWAVGDNHGSYPILLNTDGTTELAATQSNMFSLTSGDYIKNSENTDNLALSLLDSKGSSCWIVKGDGTSEFSRIIAGEILLGGINVEEKILSASIAKKSDTIMTATGLQPIYPNMQKVSGWGSSSLENLNTFLVGMFSDLSSDASYYNGAKGGERAADTASRLGSIPNLLTVSGGTIPASGTVNATSSNVNNNQFLLPFSGTLAGIPGVLSNNGSVFTFTRSTPGDAVPVSADTPFLPDIGPTFRDGVALLWLGKNDFPTNTVESIINVTNTSFDYMNYFVKRILVFGHFADRDSSVPMVEKIKQANTLLQERYANQYVDSINYISSSQVWVDTGITPTAADILAQEAQTLPPSLTSDGIHFNAALNTAFTAIIKNKLNTLGWFS
jgi:hypothetical protein